MFRQFICGEQAWSWTVACWGKCLAFQAWEGWLQMDVSIRCGSIFFRISIAEVTSSIVRTCLCSGRVHGSISKARCFCENFYSELLVSLCVPFIISCFAMVYAPWQKFYRSVNNLRGPCLPGWMCEIHVNDNFCPSHWAFYVQMVNCGFLLNIWSHPQGMQLQYKLMQYYSCNFSVVNILRCVYSTEGTHAMAWYLMSIIT